VNIGIDRVAVGGIGRWQFFEDIYGHDKRATQNERVEVEPASVNR